MRAVRRLVARNAGAHPVPKEGDIDAKETQDLEGGLNYYEQ
jgi:hypothetical protein